MRRHLSNFFFAIANWFDGGEFVRSGEALAKRADLLEKQNAQLILDYFNDETRPRFAVDPEWTEEDAAALKSFFATSTGQRLTVRFRAVAANVAVEGCKDFMHTSHSAGAAFGWGEACEWFIKLSRVSRVPDTKSEEAPEGEEQLLERWSP
jgi:hypothetical protein